MIKITPLIMILMLTIPLFAAQKTEKKTFENRERFQIGIGIEGVSGSTKGEFSGTNGIHEFDADLIFGVGLNIDLSYQLTKWFALYGGIGGRMIMKNQYDYGHPVGESRSEYEADDLELTTVSFFLKFGGEFLAKTSSGDFFLRAGVMSSYSNYKYDDGDHWELAAYSLFTLGGEIEFGVRRGNFDLYFGVAYLHNLGDPEFGETFEKEESPWLYTAYEGYDIPIYIGLRYNFLRF